MTERIEGKYDAIILQERTFNEADVMVTALTAERGHQTFIARGLKKEKSRLRGLIAPFSECRLQLVAGKGLPVLTGADLIDAHNGIRTNYRYSSAALYICDLFHQMAAENEANPGCYQLLREGLAILPAVRSWQWILYMEWALLKEAGFAADLERCSVCGERLLGYREALVAGSDGDFFHKACQEDGAGASLSVAAFAYLQYLDRADLGHLGHIFLTEPARHQVYDYLGQRYQYILDFPLTSRQSVRHLFASPSLDK